MTLSANRSLAVPLTVFRAAAASCTNSRRATASPTSPTWTRQTPQSMPRGPSGSRDHWAATGWSKNSVSWSHQLSFPLGIISFHASFSYAVKFVAVFIANILSHILHSVASVRRCTRLTCSTKPCRFEIALLHSSRQFVPHAAQESLDGAVGVLRGAEQEYSLAEEAAAVARYVRVRENQTIAISTQLSNLLSKFHVQSQFFGKTYSCNLPAIPLHPRPPATPPRPSSSRWMPTPP